MITAEFIETCRLDSEKLIPDGLPVIEGFSSYKVRALLHNLCSLDPCNYLEIGTHIGSTLIPAMYGNNHAKFTCIDNWTPHPVMFNHTRDAFEKNLKSTFGGKVPANLQILEADMFTVDVNLIQNKPVNVYFFDGPHSLEAQKEAFIHFNPVFAKTFVAVVDDWNYAAEVQTGTREAFQALNYRVVREWLLKGDYNGSEAGYWNGIGMFLIEKP